MKRFLFIAGIIIPGLIFGQTSNSNSVPTELLTNDSTYWSITTVSNSGYVNKTPGSYYNSYTSGGGMIVHFKFLSNNRFVFQLYIQANTFNFRNEVWTEVEGKVEFKKDAKGQNVFVTTASKGTYRTIQNGKASSRAILESELRNQHSGIFLWERTTFPDDPKNIYLLMIDLKKYPSADISKPSTIDPTWINKFHIPAVN